jgi:hypothetical protein
MFKCFVVVFAAILLLVGAARAESLSPPAFTAAFAAVAAAAMPDAKVTITGELSTDTRSAKGETTTSDLHNAYRVYLGRPQDIETIIANYVRILPRGMPTPGMRPIARESFPSSNRSAGSRACSTNYRRGNLTKSCTC